MLGGLAKQIKLLDSQTLHRTAPQNLASSDNELFATEYSKTIPARNVYNITNAVVTAEGYVFCNQQMIADSAQGNKRTDLLWESTSTKPLKSLKGEHYAIIHGRWTFGYYHWLSETVPKLIYLSQNYNLAELTLLLPKSNDTAFAKQFLIDYPFKNVAFFEDNTIVHLGHAIYVPDLYPGGNMPADIAKMVHDKYASQIVLPPQQTVFVSRAKAPVRNIVNEAELLAAITALGVKVVYTEDMSIKEQIAMFAASKTVISLHGAALTNMLFMQANSNVVELRIKGDSHNNCYFSMASAAKQNYYYLLCAKEDESKSTQLTNCVVDKEEIISLIKQISVSTTT